MRIALLTPIILSRSEGSLGPDNKGAYEDWHVQLPADTLPFSTPGDPSLRLRMTDCGVLFLSSHAALVSATSA